MTGTYRITVLGIGNTLNRDEGVGVHALAALESAYRPLNSGLEPQIEFLDGGTLGLNLLSVVEEATYLLVLDAVDARQPPGAVIELTKGELRPFAGIKLSQHQATFQEVLGLAAVRGHLPAHLHFIGIQPADLEMGLELSPTVAAVVPEVVRRACAVLGSWERSIRE